MPNSTQLTFEVTNTTPLAKLGFETWLDDQLIFSTDHVRELTNISVPVEDDDSEHVLKLVLKNKLFQHTQLSDNGEIVSDAVLEIKCLAFDGVALTHQTAQQAVYIHDFNGTAELSRHTFFGTMGCNGTVELKFTTPVYLWLLEHM